MVNEYSSEKTVFVAMPFGYKKPLKGTYQINFDNIYEKSIKSAVIEMGLNIIRADEENNGGIIHTLMYERLVCSDIVIVDITNQNPNVYYELGFRHCAKPYHTIIIYDKKHQIPFDIALLRAIPYELKRGEIPLESANKLKEEIKKRIELALNYDDTNDSPAFELISDFPTTVLSDGNIKIFKNTYSLCEKLKDELQSACNTEEIGQILTEIEKSSIPIYYIAYEIIKSYKRLKEWTALINFLNCHKDSDLKDFVHVKQQLALALNKRGQNTDRENAIRILENILKDIGESSETYGLLGSINKELMLKSTTTMQVGAFLDKSISNYRSGFLYDTTNYYTGINLATLLLYKNDIKSSIELQKIIPVIVYNIELQDFSISADYWLLATVYEIYVHCLRFDDAKNILKHILSMQKKPDNWEIESTLKNLKLIKEIYEQKELPTDWYEIYEDELNTKEVKNVLE